MLQLIHLRKRYADRQVLDDVSLAVRRGETVALVGANGSGKTTLLRCIVGLHRPDSGRIAMDGFDVQAEGRAARAKMSYLPQRTEFPATLTVREILAVVASLRNVHVAAVDREIMSCGLDSVATRTVSRLSGGERQRVALAALLIPEVDLYLLDEPTANLDVESTSVLRRRVCALRDEGKAVLFTTHIESDLGALATRVMCLRRGQIAPTRSTTAEVSVHAKAEYLPRVDGYVAHRVCGEHTRA